MKENNCILNLLKLILLLQNNSSNISKFNCKNSYLGSTSNYICYNTRVITLYAKNGSILSVPYNNGTSSYFRICSIDNNCIKLLILRYDNGLFYSTNEFVTIRINCICAIKCITDISLNCL